VKRTIKLPLKIASVEALGIKSLDKDSTSKADMRLSHYDWLDKQRKELQKEKNGLESFIYETRDKLETDDIIEASTEKEREELSAALAAANDWLDENSETATTGEYRAQSKILRDKADKIHFRIKERRIFPKAAAEFRKSIENNRDILSTITEIRNVTEEERDSAVKQLDSAIAWFDSKQTEQFASAKNVDPVITTDELARKQSDVDFVVKMLTRKPKKKIEKPKIETTTTEEGAEGAEGEKSEKAEEGEKVEGERTEGEKVGEEKKETKETEKEKESVKEEKEKVKEEKVKEEKVKEEKVKEEKTKEKPKETKKEEKKDTKNGKKDTKKDDKKDDKKKDTKKEDKKKPSTSSKGTKKDTKKDSKSDKDEL